MNSFFTPLLFACPVAFALAEAEWAFRPGAAEACHEEPASLLQLGAGRRDDLSAASDAGGARPRDPSAASLVELPRLRLQKTPRPSRAEAGVASVDALIGTGGHGHTFPGAATPWGMVLATPWAHGGDPWDSQAGFHYSPSEQVLDFYGMAHTALSGAGSGEMGELRLLPLGEEGQASVLAAGSVRGAPGYFSGSAGPALGACQVRMEATATPRAAVHRFGFPETANCSGWPRRLVQLSLQEPPGSFWGYKLEEHRLRAVGPRRLEGCSASRITGIGNADSLLCFALEFDRPFRLPAGARADSLDSEVLLEFPRDSSSIVARVAVSRFDVEHARGTLDRELGERSFEQVRAAAQGLWQAALGAAKVEIEPSSRLRDFYTALYHSMLFPSLLSEEDGLYRLQRNGSAAAAMRGEEPFSLETLGHTMPALRAEPGGKAYSTFSLWDTYRSLHPLMSLIQPEVSKGFRQSLLKMAEVWGYLPPWQLVHSPSDMMEGDGGSVALATMARDGLLDANATFAALRRARDTMYDAGYSDGSFHGRVSRALEEARADQCTARLAKRLGRDAEAERFGRRADSVFGAWDQDHKAFVPPYKINGSIDVNEIGFRGAFAEGTPLQYSWGAEWGLEKLVALHGGLDNFTCALDYFFTAAPEPRGDQADVTGNLHGFTMGNEPDFHTPYLFSLVGRPARTQAVVDKLVKEMFADRPDGLPGNDDLGAMSSWLVFSMLGLYPADVCSEDVALGRPFVTSATLRVRGGTLLIKVNGQGEENKYVERLTWNGRELDTGRRRSGGPPFTLPWSELHQSGELVFFMTSSAPADELCCQSIV